jgi:5'-3' exonuclease
VATDHVIESFRNELWPGYKTSEGIEPDLWAQFPLLEEVLTSAGIVVWPMVEFEADDALAAGATAAARDTRVERVIICTPDKDLAQCVSGKRIVQLNRRTSVTIDEAGVLQKFGVLPASIPDYLALVGDAADGYPGLKGWGAKSSAAVLAKFLHLEAIPPDSREWHVNVTNAGALADTLSRERERALLFRTLATLRTDIELFDNVDQLRWSGPTPEFAAIAARLDAAVTEGRRARPVRS